MLLLVGDGPGPGAGGEETSSLSDQEDGLGNVTLHLARRISGTSLSTFSALRLPATLCDHCFPSRLLSVFIYHLVSPFSTGGAKV